MCMYVEEDHYGVHAQREGEVCSAGVVLRTDKRAKSISHCEEDVRI